MGYEELLSLIGIGRYHHCVILACALSNAADAVEIVAISFVISAGKDDLGMTDLSEGILTAIIFLGMMFGGWIWGSMADQASFGRKRILFWSLLTNGIFGLLSAFAVDFYMLLVLRFCSGLGVGGSIPVTFTYAAEFLPKEKRGMYLALLAVSWPFAATLTSLFAFAIIPNVDTLYIGSIAIQSWRIFLIPCCTPAFFACFIFYKFADYSPKWLLFTKYDYVRASNVLTRIYNVCKDNNADIKTLDPALFAPKTLKAWLQSQSDIESALLLDTDSMNNNEVSMERVENVSNKLNKNDEASNMIINDMNHQQNEVDHKSQCCVSSNGIKSVWIKTKLLFSAQYRRSHILAGIVWFTLSFGFYGLAEWLPSYFGSKSDINEYSSNILTSAAQFPGAILTCWLLEVCCDRKTTLAVAIGCGACVLIGIPYLQNGEEIVALMCVFNGVTVCAWSALDVLSTELSPTHIRSTAYGFFAAMGRIGAIFGNLTFGLFGGDDIGSALTVCGFVLAAGTISCLFLPSTRGVAIK